MNSPRFWQNTVLFNDGKRATLTIQSEQGRSDNNERIFVLQALGSVRAQHGWQFSFQGGPQEAPAFAPVAVELDAVAVHADGVPHWFVYAAQPVAA